MLKKFQSTLPVGEATCRLDVPGRQWIFISIHASRGGSDRLDGFREFGTEFHFNPRFPWGKRRKNLLQSLFWEKFQSTLPVGEATDTARHKRASNPIFQSTLPVGEATHVAVAVPHIDSISIHASRGGSDSVMSKKLSSCFGFQSTLPVGEATILTKYAEFA